MRAAIIRHIVSLEMEEEPLQLADLPIPEPGDNEIRIKVLVCGVCHTELDEIEGRTPPPVLPVIPGHQAVGIVKAVGENTKRFVPGQRVGVGWINYACGHCSYCTSGRENLCPEFKATGRDANGGYAEYMTIHEDFAFPLPDGFPDYAIAPLLCAGAIGYRSLMLAGLTNGQALGLTGFGASAHLVLQMAKYMLPLSDVYIFARQESERGFARSLGAVWAGAAEDRSPRKLDAIIDTTPAWKPIVEGMKNLAPGGRMVINAIRKEEKDKDCLLKLDYTNELWMEKEIKSVANVSRNDIGEMLKLARTMKMQSEVQEYKLEDCNRALMELKRGQVKGAKVLRIAYE